MCVHGDCIRGEAKFENECHIVCRCMLCVSVCACVHVCVFVCVCIHAFKVFVFCNGELCWSYEEATVFCVFCMFVSSAVMSTSSSQPLPSTIGMPYCNACM